MRKQKTKKRFIRTETRIAVGENGRIFEAVISGDCQPVKIHIDAEPYRSQLERRCDYAIQICPHDTRAFFFVELKGTDVLKAAEQLLYSVECLQSLYQAYNVSRTACIVASCGPKPAISTRYQMYRAKLESRGFRLVCKTWRMMARIDQEGRLSALS